MPDYLEVIENKCLEYLFKVERESHRLLITSKNSKHTIDVSWCRGAKYICVDNDNTDSVYHMPYTKHKKLSAIMTAIENKLEEK